MHARWPRNGLSLFSSLLFAYTFVFASWLPPPLDICQSLVPSYDCPLVLCITLFCVAINPIVRVTISYAMSAAAPVK